MQEVMRRPRRVILVLGLIFSLGVAAFWWTGVQAQDEPPIELSMNRGWNLISLPFQLPNPSINSVLPLTHPASAVMTYGNASELWRVSRRNSTSGLFTGEVQHMVATTAYFVFTDSPEPIMMRRTYPREPGALPWIGEPGTPPVVRLVPGWNLASVLTFQIPLPGIPPGTGGIPADDYLGARRSAQGEAPWVKALLWDSSREAWISVSPGETVRLTLGATNPCTNQVLVAADVESGTEPCQAVQAGHFSNGATGDATEFDGADTVLMKRHLPIGAGIWVWYTIDSVISPLS